MRTSLIIALILILFIVVIALQNSEPVDVQILFWKVNYPPALLIPIAVLFGAILGVAFSAPAIKRRNDTIYKLKEQLRKFKPETSKSQQE